MAKIVLNVVSENPQIKHVAEDVHQAPVHKHRGKQCQPYRRGSRKLRNRREGGHARWRGQTDTMGDLIRDERISICEHGSSFGRRELLKDYKDKNIDRDY